MHRPPTRRKTLPSCSSIPITTFCRKAAKIWPRVKEVALENGLLDNLRAINSAVRGAGIQVFIVPHRRWEHGDYECWHHPDPTQLGMMKRHTFARGEWGGEWHPDFAPQPGDVVIKEHWGQSGFANTDLDQQLKQHGISHVIVIGLLANTCIESTVALRNGAWLPCYAGARCDGGLQPRHDACGA